jgi:hypothetical protein
VQNKQGTPGRALSENWEGTSKAMEGHGAIINAKLLYEQRIVIDELLMDDDSPMLKLLKPMIHQTLRNGRVETKGALPEDYPDPT